MSTYREIVGKKIKKVTSDPSTGIDGQMWYNSTTGAIRALAVTTSWSSAPPALTPSYGKTGFGLQTAAVLVGGTTPPYNNVTSEYNGSGFSTGGDYPESREHIGTCGIESAGLAWGGSNASEFESQLTNEYNGTSWTNVNNYPITVSAPAGAGTQTAGLGSGGWDYSGPFSAKNTTNEYDGTNWTGGGNLNTARSSEFGGGTQTASIMAGGDKFTPGTASDNSGACEEYNGTAWTSVNSLPGTTNGYGARTTNATQTDFRILSGVSGTAFTAPYVKNYEYDGTNWSSGPAYTTARYGAGGTGTGPAAIITGGRSPSYVTTSEELNVSTNVITGAAWASGGTLSTARDRIVGAGTVTAGVAFGGAVPPNSAQTATEEYDGSSYSNGGALSTARFGCGPAGTQTAALAFAGRTAGSTYTTNSEEYGGTSWTSGGAYPVATTGLAGAGTQTAGLGFAGGIPSNLTTTNEYDGSSWTSGGALNNARSYLAGFGIQTAAVAAGGSPRGPSGNLTEEYNGSSWTASGTMNTKRDTLYGNGTESSGLVYGGNTGSVSSDCEGYDGSIWVTRPSLATARKYLGGFGNAGGTTGVATGGDTGSMSNATEEFTGETTAANIGTFSTS